MAGRPQRPVPALGARPGPRLKAPTKEPSRRRPCSIPKKRSATGGSPSRRTPRSAKATSPSSNPTSATRWTGASAAGADPESAFRAALDLSAGPDALGAEFGKSRRRRGPRSALLGLFPAYLRLALRRTVKHKGHSLINVLALTVGLAACGLVLLYVRYETSVDAFREDADRIYRVNLYRKTAQGEDVIAGNYTPLAPVLKERYPQVEAAAQVFSGGFEPQPVVYRDKAFKEANIVLG